jgi:hypothetical protein
MFGSGFTIAFAKPFLMGKKLHFIARAVQEGKLRALTEKVSSWYAVGWPVG